MAKITRKTQKIFGIDAGPNQIAQVGSLAAGSPAFSTDPDTIQALQNYLDGLLSVVIGSNSPAIEDINALYYLFSRQLAYAMQAGVPEWDANTTYYIGSFASDGSGTSLLSGGLYYSIADDNTGNALSDTTKWQRFGYESYNSYPGTWLFDGAGAVASATAVVRASRSGRSVTLTFADFAAITGTGAVAAEYSQALPAQYRPNASEVILPVFVVDNSFSSNTLGFLEVDTSGVIRLYKDIAQGAFTGSTVNANTGLERQVGLSYVVDSY